MLHFSLILPNSVVNINVLKTHVCSVGFILNVVQLLFSLTECKVFLGPGSL